MGTTRSTFSLRPRVQLGLVALAFMTLTMGRIDRTATDTAVPDQAVSEPAISGSAVYAQRCFYQNGRLVCF